MEATVEEEREEEEEQSIQRKPGAKPNSIPFTGGKLVCPAAARVETIHAVRNQMPGIFCKLSGLENKPCSAQ